MRTETYCVSRDVGIVQCVSVKCVPAWKKLTGVTFYVATLANIIWLQGTLNVSALFMECNLHMAKFNLSWKKPCKQNIYMQACTDSKFKSTREHKYEGF